MHPRIRRSLIACGLVLATSAASLHSQTTSSADTRPAASEVVNLSVFQVEEEMTHEYRATNSFSATRLPVPLAEVPFNVAVFTEEFMIDTASFGGDGDVGFSGGANRAAVSWNAAVNGKSVRGFNTLEFMRNGFIRYSDNGSATMERIEVLKGPTSVLDGVTEPGGVINVITKQPKPGQNFTKIRAAFGSKDRYISTIDINNSAKLLRADGKPLFSYRIVGSLEGGRAQSKYRVRKLENIMPSLLFQPTDKTSFMIQWEYYRVDGERGNDIDGWNRTVRINDASGLHGDVPLAVLFGIDPYISWDGPDNKQPEWLNDVFARLEHRFTDDIVLSFDFNNHKRQRRWGPYVVQNGIFQAPAPGGNPAGTNYNHTSPNAQPVMRRAWNFNVFDQEVAGFRANLAWRLDAFGGIHRFTTGYLQQIEDQHAATDEVRVPGTTQRLYEFFDVYDPAPSLGFPRSYERFAATQFNRNHFETKSFYLNHHSKWMDGRLNALWGVYHATLETSNDVRLIATGTSLPGRPVTYDTSKTMPQTGVIYSITKGVGVYANYSQSMKGNAGSLDGFDQPFGPTFGEIKEVGAKVSLFNDRLMGTFSVYQITENDRIVNDPDAPNKDNPTADPNLPRGANVQVGQVTAEGFDADLYIYPIKNFTTVFSYAYNTREVTKDALATRLGPLGGFKHKVAVVNKYTWRDGPLKGLSANANVQYVWDQVRATNRFGEPSHIDTRPAASIGVNYAWKIQGVSYRVSLHAQNLLTTRRASGYVPGTRDAYYLDNPRTYLASIDLEF
jgi:iron complex outermembrane receptor protein